MTEIIYDENRNSCALPKNIYSRLYNTEHEYTLFIYIYILYISSNDYNNINLLLERAGSIFIVIRTRIIMVNSEMLREN